jgi:c-di-GMP-binding flagellar brake protein YcgR
MFGKRRKVVKADLSALEEGCARNTPLEIFRSSGPGAPPAARGRLLAMEPDKLLIERVRDVEGEVDLTGGQEIDCFFAHKGDMRVFRTNVINTKVTAPLNGRTRVPAISLELPKRVDAGQRRARYRVMLASMEEPISVGLSQADQPGGEYGDAWWSCQLADASMFGVGVSTTVVKANRIDPARPVFIAIHLPGETSPITFQAEIRRIQEVASVEVLRLGLQFNAWPSQEQLESRLEPLAKFLEAYQRERMAKSAA